MFPAGKVLAFVENEGVKAVHAVEVIGHGAAAAERLLVDGKALAPEVKAGFVQLVQDGEAVATAFVGVAASKGANWLADAATISAVEALVKDFIAYLPTLKAAEAKLLADIKTA